MRDGGRTGVGTEVNETDLAEWLTGGAVMRSRTRIEARVNVIAMIATPINRGSLDQAGRKPGAISRTCGNVAADGACFRRACADRNNARG